MNSTRASAKVVFWLSLLTVLLVMVACSTAQAPGSGASSKAAPADSGYPKQPVELSVSGGAGGGLDQFVRGIEEALTKDKLFPGTLTIKYYDGGGGNVGMSALNEQRGKGYMMMVNTNRVFLQNMLGRTPLGLKDFTPLARLATDYIAIAVRKDSPYKTAKELLDALKKDPKAIPIAHGSGPNNDQLNILRPAMAFGIDAAKLNLVNFESGGDVMTALLGGHVGAISTGSSELMAQMKTGDIRVLAISAPKRLTDARSEIPTWKEMGVDVTIYHWRGVFGPGDMPKDAYDYWTTTFSKMAKGPAWQEVLKRYAWDDATLIGDDFRKGLEQEEAATDAALRPLGLLPDKK
ncbi:MAG: tripartite tricarboxylate transporter substrate binding protein [Chloroflexota bacterium]